MEWDVPPYRLHTLSQIAIILYFVGFLIYAGECGRDAGDEGCGGREDRHNQHQETNQPDMFVSMAPINIQMAAIYYIYFFVLLQKSDPIEDTLGVRRSTNWDSIFN